MIVYCRVVGNGRYIIEVFIWICVFEINVFRRKL